MQEEIMVPGVRLAIVEEMLYDTVKDTHKNIKGMFALQQQFYFFTLNVFKEMAKTEEESMIKIIATHDNREELMERLNLSGVTRLEIVMNPGTVKVMYPKYDSRWEYRATDIYNTVYIENPPESPAKITRIEKEGESASELFCVRKKDSWPMREWSEVLLYPYENLFETKIDILLQFFGISREDFDYAVSSFNE